mgnify:CR=1 FL=1
MSVFKPGQIIAWVGDQPIQVGDVMPLVEQVMAPRLAELDPKVVEQQKAAIEEQKEKLMRQLYSEGKRVGVICMLVGLTRKTGDAALRRKVA